MSDFDRNYASAIPADRADMSVDAGLRSFMLGVYNKLALGLVLSGALAWVTSSVEPVRDLLFKTTAGGAFAGAACSDPLDPGRGQRPQGPPQFPIRHAGQVSALTTALTHWHSSPIIAG